MLIRIAEVIETDIHVLIYGETDDIQNGEWKEILFLGIGLIVAFIVATVLFHYESNLRNIMYYNIGYTLLVYGFLPWIYIFAGWIAGRIIGKVFKLKPCKFKYKDYIRKALKCVLGISLLLNFPIFIRELINRFRYYFLNSTELMNPV